MQIVPMRDLKNTVEIERKCAEENGPVFVTKNGYGRLVVMDIEYYERTMQSMEEARMVNRRKVFTEKAEGETWHLIDTITF